MNNRKLKAFVLSMGLGAAMLTAPPVQAQLIGQRGDSPAGLFPENSQKEGLIYTNAFLTDATMTLTAAPIGPLATPLTLEALSDGNIVVGIIDIGGKGGGVYPGSSKGGPGEGGSSNFSRKYSVNGGEKTTIYETTTIEVNAGDRVQLYGNGTSAQVNGGDYVVVLQGTAETKVYGNIMSLIDETGYATLTTLPNGSFSLLFFGNENLTDASGLLLPATTLADDCYYYMFSGCTSLTTAPALPATTLAESCYYGMFSGCTNLNSVTCMATDISADGCTTGWLDGVATSGTFITPSTTNWSIGVSGIPSGWTREDAQ